MKENEVTNTLLNLEIPPSLDNAAKNLTNKPTENIGTTIADLWYIVFGGVSNYAEKKRIKYAHSLEQYRQELENSISNIPEEKQLEPSLQVTAQALENSKYCVEEKELRDMFTSLICNSMNSDFSNNVHPSFAEIIKQMSVLDAKIIQLYKEHGKSIIGLPICQYQLDILNPLSKSTIPEHIFLELPDVDFQLCSQSLSSLSRLGIISISYSQKLTTPNIYDKFREFPLYKSIKYSDSPFKIFVSEGVASLTPLGRSFVEVCVPN